MAKKELIIGDIYLYGLLGIAEKNEITLQQAAEKAVEDCRATHGEEHIPFILGALKILTAQETKSENK